MGNKNEGCAIYDKKFIDLKATGALSADCVNVARAFASKLWRWRTKTGPATLWPGMSANAQETGGPLRR